MKRNMNLLRLIMIGVERLNGPVLASAIEIDGYEDAEIIYHVELLLDSGFIGVYEKNTAAGDYVVVGLSNAGHDFVEFYRETEFWKKVLGCIRKKDQTVTFSMLVNQIELQAKEKLDI